MVQEQQFNFVKEIAVLKENNPSYEIHFLFERDNHDNDFYWMGGEIISVKLGRWLVCEEQIFIDGDEAIEHFEDYLEYTREDANKELEKMKPAILVRIAG